MDMTQDYKRVVDAILAEFGRESHQAIPVLQAIQQNYNYLPQEAMDYLCAQSEITPAQLYGISTFYSQFRHNPVGKHIIKVCVGTACHVKGAMQVYDGFKRELQIEGAADTDGLFTVDKIACLGCCTIAPVVQIDDITYGHVSTQKIPEILEDFLTIQSQPKKAFIANEKVNRKKQGEVRIGLGSCCVASGSAEVKTELERTLDTNKIEVDVKHVGCVGICNQVPLLEIHKPGKEVALYTKIRPDEVSTVIKKHFKPRAWTDRFKAQLYGTFEDLVFKSVPLTTRRYNPEHRDTPVSDFLDQQIAIATEFRGVLSPLDLEEYKQLGGFAAFNKCVSEQKPKNIINQIKQSGLKGRGGGGFPAAIKWEILYEAQSDVKYIICNGDEGDPGAFMDRMLLESYPFRIIEGLLIAGYAVGATEGIFYIRAEYPLAVSRIREAIAICRKAGYIGKNILGSGFDLEVDVFEGAGAFVCGEETALIASIEGKRGMPSMRPPYPAEKGLWGKPTLINNTETLACVPWIVRKGAAAFEDIGTKNSKGTKVFALAGKISRGGLIEVPMGMSIRQIVEDIGGGIPDGKSFKAVQIGGPSGGCIPASMVDLPIDFDSLDEVGAMMGSGGLVVMDDSDCMVDIARYFLSFTEDQSCGKCTFCRVGTRQMLEILNRICRGEGRMKDLDVLEELAETTKSGSLCGLGKTAPNPVLSTLQYFREEYIEHINGCCPTGKCQELIQYHILDTCIGCTICAQRCPTQAIAMAPYEQHMVQDADCVKCDVCRQVCPVDAVIVKPYD